MNIWRVFLLKQIYFFCIISWPFSGFSFGSDTGTFKHPPKLAVKFLIMYAQNNFQSHKNSSCQLQTQWTTKSFLSVSFLFSYLLSLSNIISENEKFSWTLKSHLILGESCLKHERKRWSAERVSSSELYYLWTAPNTDLHHYWFNINSGTVE